MKIGGEVALTERTNEQWLVVLGQSGPECEAGLSDLRAFLVRGLGYALSARPGIDRSLIEDFVQEALVKILSNLKSFRGESCFTTWAQAIAVRTAFTELRRRRWRDVSLDQMIESTEFEPDTLVDPSADPEKQAKQEIILKIMHRVINSELTERQRQGLVAELLKGVPQEEIARRMGTNRNAFYKLLFDARQRLKKGLLAAGLSAEDVRSAFDL